MDADTAIVSPTMSEPASGRLAELYERHAPQAVGFAYLLTADKIQAEDLVQEAFVRITGRFAHLRTHDSFDAYLRRTIVNLHTSKLRRLKLEREWVARESTMQGNTFTEPDIDSREALRQALQDLPARQRAAIVLRYYQDLSERQAADALGCSPAALRSLVARGMEVLRAQIGSDER